MNSHFIFAGKDTVELAKGYGTPLFVYSQRIIKENYRKITDAIPYNNKSVYFAMMSNYNPKILRIIKNTGAGLQIESIDELLLAKRIGFNKENISFTSCGESKEDIESLIKEGVQINIESLEALKDFGKITQKLEDKGKKIIRKVGIRVYLGNLIAPLNNQLQNSVNLPNNSNIGISINSITQIKKICKQYSLTINGIHGYLASNIMDIRPFKKISSHLIKFAEYFPEIEYINLGSGFGIPKQRSTPEFKFNKLGIYYSKLLTYISQKLNRDIKMIIEPGRSFVGTAGILLTKITRIKKLSNNKLQIYVDAGFGEFARPYIYGTETKGYHEIINCNKYKYSNGIIADIRASTVLQTDILGKNRKIARPDEGNILAILNTGAYAMQSGFPKPRAKAKTLII